MLTAAQVAELIELIKQHADYLLVTIFGSGVVDSKTLDALIAGGFIPPGTDPKIFEYAYVLGKLKAMVTADEYRGMKFAELRELAKERWPEMQPLTNTEKLRIDMSQRRAAVGLQRVSQDIQAGMYRELEKQIGQAVGEATVKDIVRDEVVTATKKRMTVESLAAAIPRRLKSYSRDWLRVAATELHQARQWGAADAMVRGEGQYKGFGEEPEDKLVFVQPTKGACDECNRDYLEPNGIPKIFRLTDLLGNGTNIGVPKKERKAVVPPHHPWPLQLEGTEALTQAGWRPLGEVGVGELVLGVDLESGDGGWAKVVRTMRYSFTGDLDYFHNTRVDLVATPDHRHPVMFREKAKGRNDARVWKFVPGNELPVHDWKFCARIPAWKGAAKAVVPFQIDASLEEFVELLGWYLSEGTVTIRENSAQMVISQSPDSSHRQEIIELLEAVFPRVWAGDGVNVYAPIPLDFAHWLKELGAHSWEKRVPEEIKGLSKKLLGVFLDTYLKGDGHYRTGRVWKGYAFAGEKTYYTASPQMAADIGELILKVGNRPTYWLHDRGVVEHHNGTYKSRPVWHIRENRQAEPGCRTIRRDKLSVVDEPVGCLELLQFHSFFVRRNGKVLLTGNCLCDLNYIPPGHKFNADGKLYLADPAALVAAADKAGGR